MLYIFYIYFPISFKIIKLLNLLYWLLTSTSYIVSGFVQELYGEEVKKYHLDDLKTYCPRAENSPTTTSIARTAMSLPGFPGQGALTLHSLFSDCWAYNWANPLLPPPLSTLQPCSLFFVLPAT